MKTSIEDIDKLLGYLNKQIGWVEVAKLQKTLGATAVDDRKISAINSFGFIQRDGGNIKITELGKKFAGGDRITPLRSAISGNDLYRQTIEWLHYGKKAEVTAADIGQYWESHHKDTLGDLKGSTLKDGAVCFGRVADGAGLGTFKVGRAGRETRFMSDLPSIASYLDGQPLEDDVPETSDDATSVQENSGVEEISPEPGRSPVVAPPPPVVPAVTVSASPSVHVNVEIHIAANATADTVKEIFKNMAKYVLDKRVSDDDGN